VSYLRALLDRNGDGAADVRALLPARFAPDGGTILETTTKVIAASLPAREPEQAAPREATRAPLPAPQAPERARPQPGAEPRVPAPASRPRTAEEPVEASVEEGHRPTIAAPQERAASRRPARDAVTSTDVLDDTAPSTPAPVGETPAARAVEPPPAITRTAPPREHVAAPLVPEATAEPPAEPRSEPARRPAPLVRSPVSEALAPRREREAGSTGVRVRIGRVEVRAPSTPPTPSTPRPPAWQPALPLDDYLRERSR
jgi:hypothetical protein